MKNILFVSVLTLILSSCVEPQPPTMFGMYESQFRQLSASQQAQVIDSYNRQQEIKKQNEPFNNLIRSAQFVALHK